MEECDDGCQDTGPTHSHATPDSIFLLGEGAHSASPHLSPIHLRVNSVSALYTSACSLASSRFSHRSQRPIAQSIPANSTLDFFNSQLETYAAKTASRLHLQRKYAPNHAWIRLRHEFCREKKCFIREKKHIIPISIFLSIGFVERELWKRVCISQIVKTNFYKHQGANSIGLANTLQYKKGRTTRYFEGPSFNLCMCPRIRN